MSNKKKLNANQKANWVFLGLSVLFTVFYGYLIIVSLIETGMGTTLVTGLLGAVCLAFCLRTGVYWVRHQEEWEEWE